MTDSKPDTPASSKISVQEISLPKGGGAMRGIGDSFTPNFFSGTGSYSIPFPLTPARGLDPQVSLNYNSGAGNSEFGLGFSDSLPKISVVTNKKIPRYQGEDNYTLDGVGELVKKNSTSTNPNPRKEKNNSETFTVTTYLPRIENSFSKIELWTSNVNGISSWEVISTTNVTSLYGRTENGRISNPDDPLQVFEWLIEESTDAKGNKIRYAYKSENNENVPQTIYEVNRSFTANRYIQVIKYGNYFDEQNNEQFAFEVIFDYGEYDLQDLQKVHTPTRYWACRKDPFSSYRSGFEIRTYRLCQHVLLFHHFQNELGDPCIVKSMAFDYQHLQDYHPVLIQGLSLLVGATITGYRKNADNSFSEQSLPSLVLTYSSFSPPQSPVFKTLSMGGHIIPGYLDGSQFLPVDLNGDGLPGLLFSNKESTIYLEPQGDGKYSFPNTAESFPVNRNLQGGGSSLTDFDGNGELELLVNTGSQSGFYQQDAKGGWANFRSFFHFPNAISDPKMERVDLNANGKTDLLLADTEELQVYYSEGKKGFGPCEKVINENGFPLKKQGYRQELVTFADFFGDGLAHRIKISSGVVECWPCSGYGRYGKKITFGNAPVFGEEFDSNRIFLADIDGSGTSDIVYVHPERIDIFLNQSGNSFSNPITVALPALFSNIDQISFSDILGTGTSCLVFTKIAPAPVHYYYNFVGETHFQDDTVRPSMKPYLLNEISNNMGSVTKVQYCSSTKFALEDKLAGRPWVTKLRFPVQVVEQITLQDLISGSVFVNKFRYHDGYYDPVEREFRGFGFVESWDTETFEKYQQAKTPVPFPVNRINQELYVPPVYTKTWYHTGAFEEFQAMMAQYRSEFFKGDTQALDFPDSVFGTGIFSTNPETIRQAYCALKSNLIRKEVYANDQSADAVNPYTVEESNYEIALKQPAATNVYAVFAVYSREAISYNYERDPADPLIKQQFVLAIDPMSGGTQKSCAAFLPRRNSNKHGIKVYPEQQLLKLTANSHLYYNTTDENPTRLRGIVYDSQEFEILGISQDSGKYFSYNVIKQQVLAALQNIIPYQQTPDSGSLQARQYTWTTDYYWNDEQDDALPLGQVSSRALLHHRSAAMFTKQNISQVFGNRLTDQTIQDQGGYFFDARSGYWLNRGLVQYYFIKPNSFYQPCKTENSFADPASSLYQKTTLTYDPYFLTPISTIQYLDKSTVNLVSSSIDYVVMKPKQLIDINKNVSQVIYDCLGQVCVTSLFGTENNVQTGGMRLYEYLGQPAEYINRNSNAGGGPITFEDVLANASYYLQGAASYFFYDLDAYSRSIPNGSPRPLNSITLLRENYYHLSGGVTDFSCQQLIAFSDGSGRSIEKKQLVDPGVAITRDAAGKLMYEKQRPVQVFTDSRWLVSGRIVYNNKNKPCEEYFPYFSNMPYYETQDEIVSEQLVPPPTVTQYDPLLRVIRIDTPKGFFSKVLFTPWEVIKSDEDDTVKESAYYLSFMANYPAQPTQEQMDEKDALEKASVFSETPAIRVLDNTGGVFLNTQSLPERLLTGYQQNDIQGREILTIDPRLYQSNLNKKTSYYNFKYAYAMGETKAWFTDSADAGIALHLSNIFDNLVWSWSPRDYCQLISYDRLQRRTAVRVKKVEGSDPVTPPTADFNLVEIFTYGETQPAGGYNLRGQLFQLNDLSGIVINSEYSMQNEVVRSSRQMAKEYKTAIDWNGSVEMDLPVYSIRQSYNALKNLLTETTPDETITTHTYNQSGLLDKVAITYLNGNTQPLVNYISYDANEKRTAIGYANGVNSFYTYEDTTLRLVKLYSQKALAQPVKTGDNGPMVQAISYTYDPVGNITRSWDHSFETVFNNNQKVDPLADYTYDAVYHLIKSNGRQHPGINGNTYKNNSADNSFKQSIFSQLPAVNDADKLENYSELYTYDDSGNLVEKQHVAVSASWTVPTPVLDNCNRLSNLVYDASGNLRQLAINNTVTLSFNCCENLVKSGIIQRPGELDDSDYYLYDSGEQRTRKVSERMTNGGAVTQVEDKVYLGNYEVKQVKNVDASGKETIVLIRQTLRVMDNNSCLAIQYYWVQDDTSREAPIAGTLQLRYQMNNNLGSVSLEMDPSALLISYEEYFPYGGTAIIAGSNQTEVALKEYRYSGKECDDSTGLYYYGARYYLSWLGRWLKPDPKGAADGVNLYAFVGGNPITFNDPDGSTREYAVSEGTRKHLQDAREAINWARDYVPYAGNTRDDVVTTYAESSARLSVARSILTLTFGDNEVSLGGNNAISRAVSAIGAHGGACNEFSALTHTRLIMSVTTQPIIRVWDPHAHHSFTLIGDPRATPASQIVVADAWPSRPQAATLEDTRWTRQISASNLQVSTQTPLVGSAQATYNTAVVNYAYGLIPSASRLPIYTASSARASVYHTSGTAGRDDARSGVGSYNAYYNSTLTWDGLFANDYSTNASATYYYYSTRVNNRGYTYNGWRFEDTSRVYHDGYTSSIRRSYY